MGEQMERRIPSVEFRTLLFNHLFHEVACATCPPEDWMIHRKNGHAAEDALFNYVHSLERKASND